jgi:transcriptional regulator with XRE-family HTH domain
MLALRPGPIKSGCDVVARGAVLRVLQITASILMDNASSMKEATDPLNQRIAQRVQQLRAARGLSLDGLARGCGVSRSMISLIERGESSATAVVLDKLATGLGVPLASLFDAPSAAPQRAAEPVSRAAEQSTWRDPQSGYERRNVSPSGVASPIQIVEVLFPPKARVAYETGARDVHIHQQVWVLQGSIEVTVGDAVHRLKLGDCLAFVLDQPTVFRNPTRQSARYAVVLVSSPLAAPRR